MGSSSSKPRNNEALVLCKERTQYMKEAIDARFNLSAAHLSYTQSLCEIGSSLREFTEAELCSDPSLSTSDRDKSPSHSSLPSPSNGESPFSPPVKQPTVSHMKTGGSNSVVTVKLNPSTLGLTDQNPNTWDYFESNTNKSEGLKQSKETEAEEREEEMEKEKEELEREICEEELITHRAKEFLSSVKDLENRFVRASEAGNELAKMLETNKIRLSISTDFSSGKPTASSLILALNQVCFKKETLLKQDHNYTQQVSKVVTWNRALSSISSSSRENEDEKIQKNNEFIEQFSMISGSNSSTLDRLYAWEKKLYDEIKASECVRKVYDQKCSLLRQQFARDMKAQSIDKTRAVIKDLHSRLCVSIQAVDSISKRIERMRDEELQPQLVELVHEMIRMWRSMLECHLSQFITISLAYHTKCSNTKTEGQNANLTHLLEELDSFASSFVNWINSQRNYIKALNAWLQKCVLQPQERRRGRRKAIFPPPQALSPPIFILCKDWLNGIESLPLDELLESIRALGLVLRDEFERKENEMERFQSGLRRLFDKLNKFAEASLKVCEEVKHAHEVARVAYKMVESSDVSVNSRVSL